MLSFKDFLVEKKSEKSRFMSKITKSKNGCWTFSGRHNYQGYSQIWSKGQARPGHKLAWELFRGAIPAGQVLRHKCNTKGCCNPAHFELGSKGENNRDTSKDGHVRNQHTGPLKGSARDRGTEERGSRSK
jgi:hypothetical protein